MNHVEAIEGFEVAIAALLEKMSICEFYPKIYIGVPLASQSIMNSQQLQNSAALYAAVIVFGASIYFKSRGTYVVCGLQHIIKLC